MASTNLAVIYAGSAVDAAQQEIVAQIHVGMNCLSAQEFVGQIQIAADVGSHTGRPAFGYVREIVNSGGCDVLIAADSSRLSRDQSELAKLVESAANHGMNVIFADGRIDLDFE